MHRIFMIVVAALIAIGSSATGLIASVPAIADALTPGDHGFLYTGGSFTPLDAPGAIVTRAYGINDAGQIVGQFFDGRLSRLSRQRR